MLYMHADVKVSETGWDLEGMVQRASSLMGCVIISISIAISVAIIVIVKASPRTMPSAIFRRIPPGDAVPRQATLYSEKYHAHDTGKPKGANERARSEGAGPHRQQRGAGEHHNSSRKGAGRPRHGSDDRRNQ